MTKDRLLLAILLCAFPLAACGTAPQPVEYTDTAMLSGDHLLGKPLPSFRAQTTGGAWVASKDARGRVLVVQVWGVNCGSCLEEMEFLDGLYQELRDKGLEIWGVNSEQMGREEIASGLAQFGKKASYPLLLDPEMEVTRLFTSWFIPVTAIVDREGMVQYYKIGFNQSDRDRVRIRIEGLLK